jgi:HEAT repeat protein
LFGDSGCRADFHRKMSRPPLFVSYSHWEDAFALQLAADLRAHGVSLWMDRLDAAIRTGDNWRRAIEQAIDTCSGMIAILSPDYVQSDYCLKELARIAERRLQIFAVSLRRVPRVPLDLQLTHQTDFSQSDEPAHYQAAFATLLDDLRTTAEIGPPLDREASYLVHLVAQMEATRGVHSYVALAGEASSRVEAPHVRPAPRLLDDWGLGGEFAILEAKGGRGDPGAAQPAELGETGELARLDITQTLDQHPRFVLLGSPGAGKTTTLQRLALDAARRRLADPLAQLPLLLRLPQWRGEPTFGDFLETQWPFESDPKNAGQSLLLLLDGLNEMGANGPAKTACLRAFLTRQSEWRVVAACRGGDYDAALNLELTRVTIQPMDDACVRRFARVYLEENADAFLARIGLPADDEDRRIEIRPERQALSALAANPYLLVGLMAIARESAEEKLPENPGSLFRLLTTLLWERERMKDTAGWVPLEALRFRLCRLACRAIEGGQSTELPEALVVEHLDAGLRRAACAATLLESTGEGVRFYHQLIEEYFAAEGSDVSQLAGRIAPPAFELHGRRRGPWDEVVIAKCALIVPADPLIAAITVVNPYLAAEALASRVEVGAPTRDALVAALIDVVHRAKHSSYWSLSPKSEETTAAIRALGQIKAREAVPLVIGALRIGDTGIVSAACEALAEIGDAVAAPPLIGFLRAWQHSQPGRRPLSVRREIYGRLADAAVSALVRLGKPGVPHLLEALPQDSRRAEAVLYVLGRIGDPAAIEPIVAYLRENISMTICSFAYQALGRLRAQDAVPLLKAGLGSLVSSAETLFDLPYSEAPDGIPNLTKPPSVHAARALALIGTAEARAALEAVGLPPEPVPFAPAQLRSPF